MKHALPLLLLTASPALAHPGPAGHVHDLPVLWAILALTGLVFGGTLALALRKRPSQAKVKA